MDKHLINADPPSRNIMDHNADDGGEGGVGGGDYDDDYIYHRKAVSSVLSNVILTFLKFKF